jgi:hypothetical protein
MTNSRRKPTWQTDGSYTYHGGTNTRRPNILSQQDNKPMEKNQMNTAAAHKNGNNPPIIWGVALKTPTRQALLAATIVSLGLSALFTIVLPTNWPLLCTFLSTIIWGSFAAAYGIEFTQGWKHIRLLAAGIGLIALIGTLTHFIVKATLPAIAH